MAKVAVPMTEGAIWKRMTVFALPLLLGNLFQQLYNTVDSLIVGNFLGSSALAAVSSSGSLIFMLVGFLSGIFTGAGVIVAQAFGARDEAGVSRAVHTTVAFGLAAGAAMTLLGVVFCPHILRWMDTPESVMPEAVAYLRIFFAGAMGLIMYNVLVGILQAVGDGRHPLYYLIASSVINVLLDLVFVGLLDTGVEGAALATVLSQFISAGLCLWQLLRSKECFRLEWRKIAFHRDIMGRIIRLGLPSGVQNSIISFANVLVQSNVNAFGEMAMAGYGAYSKVEGFGFLPIGAFSLALTTFVGQNLGARQYERARKGAAFGIVTAAVMAEIIGLLLFIFARPIIAAFDPTPAVVQFGVDKARTAALFFFLLAYSHAVAAVMRGAGRAVVPMLVMMILWCGVRVAILTLLVPITQSIQTVYWVYPLTWALSSVAFFIYYNCVDWCRLPAKSGSEQT